MSESPCLLDVQVLHFLLQNMHGCIELNHVKRILPLPALESVPGSSPFLVGLMNLAGKSIPVIDLSLRLGMQRSQPYSLEQPILLCNDGSQQAGIIVDDILGLADIKSSELQMQHDFDKEESPFLAIATINTELALLLNIKHIITVNLSTKERCDTIDKNLLKKTKKQHE